MKNASNLDAEFAASTETKSCYQPTQKKSKRPFIKLDYAIKEAKSLTRTTIALYEAILWFQRNHDDCFPGYEKLGMRAKINSKTTLSLHLKVLIKVGLIKKVRRGKMQSNIYQALELTDQIIKSLNRSHKNILEEIAKEDESARKMRQAKREVRELKRTKRIHPSSQKKALEHSYPHQSEVQLMNSKEAFQASSIYSSNLNNNDSKMEKVEESRGGGFKSISVYIRTPQKYPEFGTQTPQNEEIPPGGESNLDLEKSPQKRPLQPRIVMPSEMIDKTMDQITCDLNDFEYTKRNRVWARAIFFKELRPRGVDICRFLDSLIQAKGLTMEIIGILDSPGGYFFKVLRDRWSIQKTGKS